MKYDYTYSKEAISQYVKQIENFLSEQNITGQRVRSDSSFQLQSAIETKLSTYFKNNSVDDPEGRSILQNKKIILDYAYAIDALAQETLNGPGQNCLTTHVNNLVCLCTEQLGLENRPPKTDAVKSKNASSLLQKNSVQTKFNYFIDGQSKRRYSFNELSDFLETAYSQLSVKLKGIHIDSFFSDIDIGKEYRKCKEKFNDFRLMKYVAAVHKIIHSKPSDVNKRSLVIGHLDEIIALIMSHLPGIFIKEAQQAKTQIKDTFLPATNQFIPNINAARVQFADSPLEPEALPEPEPKAPPEPEPEHQPEPEPKAPPEPEPEHQPEPGPTPGYIPGPTPGYTPGPTPGYTPEPTPGNTPEPEPEHIPEPEPDHTPEPEPEYTPEPEPEHTPEPEPENTPEPGPEYNSEPGLEHAPEPGAVHKPESESQKASIAVAAERSIDLSPSIFEQTSKNVVEEYLNKTLRQDTRSHHYFFRMIDLTEKDKVAALEQFIQDFRCASKSSDKEGARRYLNEFYSGKQKLTMNSNRSLLDIINKGQNITTLILAPFGKKTTSLQKIDQLKEVVDAEEVSSQRSNTI